MILVWTHCFLPCPFPGREPLAQYAGRLHRLYDRKTEVIIYDYADLKITMTMRMFERRVTGYSAAVFADLHEEIFSNISCKIAEIFRNILDF